MVFQAVITTSKSSDVTLHCEHHSDCTECSNGIRLLCTSIELPGCGTVELVHHIECEDCLVYRVCDTPS